MAHELTERCQPLSAQTAKSIGLVDDALPGPLIDFHESVRACLEALTLRGLTTSTGFGASGSSASATRNRSLWRLTATTSWRTCSGILLRVLPITRARRRFRISEPPHANLPRPETRAPSLVAS